MGGRAEVKAPSPGRPTTGRGGEGAELRRERELRGLPRQAPHPGEASVRSLVLQGVHRGGAAEEVAAGLVPRVPGALASGGCEAV